ncbi:hypothetical protein HJG60_010502 [Phyllostomus discolor]|uniref:Uncharacterized protein n=1 Tax=Phyllostomus discolor TaxID=89673 RepID=A0A834EEU7_9CHIR|nr:hypothetical protein HJG60_010502 [Phyllostomus discolor]
MSLARGHLGKTQEEPPWNTLAACCSVLPSTDVATFAVSGLLDRKVALAWELSAVWVDTHTETAELGTRCVQCACQSPEGKSFCHGQSWTMIGLDLNPFCALGSVLEIENTLASETEFLSSRR